MTTMYAAAIMIMLNALFLSTGAPNLAQIGPIVIIVVLIVAAAGLSRGMDIFAVFGVGSLLSVASGTGAGGAGKGFKAAKLRARTRAATKERTGGKLAVFGTLAKTGATGAVKAGASKVSEVMSSGRRANIAAATKIAEARGYGKGESALVQMAVAEGLLTSFAASRLLKARYGYIESEQRRIEAAAKVAALGSQIEAKNLAEGRRRMTYRQTLALNLSSYLYMRGFNKKTGEPISRPYLVMPILRIPMPFFRTTGPHADAVIAAKAYEKQLAKLAGTVLLYGPRATAVGAAGAGTAAGSSTLAPPPPPMGTSTKVIAPPPPTGLELLPHELEERLGAVAPPPKPTIAGANGKPTITEQVSKFAHAGGPSMEPFMGEFAGVYAVGLILSRPVTYAYGRLKQGLSPDEMSRVPHLEVQGAGGETVRYTSHVPSVIRELQASSTPDVNTWAGSRYQDKIQRADPKLWAAMTANWDDQYGRMQVLEDKRRDKILNASYLNSQVPDFVFGGYSGGAMETEDEKRARLRQQLFHVPGG